MDRSVASRLQGLFQQLDKIGGKSTKSQPCGEDLQQLRYVTSKIFQILNTQEKIHRDSVLKNSGYIDLLLSTLKNSSDRTIVLNVLHCLSELIGKTQVGKRTSVLVNANTTNVLLAAIVRESEEQATCDDLLLCSHQVLAKLAQKDRKIALKARLNRALPVTLSLIKNNSCNFKYLQTYLQVFKYYTNNSVNASYLGKHNAIPPMFRVIQQCGRKHITMLKLALDILNNLTKSRNNAARTIGGEHVPHLLALYHEWHQMDTKHRHVSVRKGILNIIKNITNLKSGRKVLADANGIQILYDSSQEVIDCREMESLILLASVIMRKCCPRNKLPLNNLQCPTAYELPESDLYPESSRQDSTSSVFGSGESQDSDNSSLEDDDDIDSDDERFKTDPPEEVEEDQGGAPIPFKRTAEDLRMYDTFFPELFEIEVDDEEDEMPPPNSIYIPTGTYESYNRVPGMGERELSCPAGMFRMSSTMSYTSSKSSGYSSLHCEEYPDNYPMERCDSATAINLKTGTSVFSLDLPQPLQSSKSALKKPSMVLKSNTTLSSNKKSKGSKKSQKDKKSTKKASSSSLASSMASSTIRETAELESEFVNSLCISPAPVRETLDNIDRVLMSSSSEEEDLDGCLHDTVVFQEMSRETKSVYRFEKLAYPDLIGAKGLLTNEALYHRKFGVQRAKVFEDIDRMIHPENVIDREVYDLDAVVKRTGSAYTIPNHNLVNRDPMRIGSQLDVTGANSLRFNSQFESGNLRKAIWVRDCEYDLILNPDVNTNHHHQWFYFEVSNMVADIPYRFNIINCEKLNSQFNFGMKPVMFSVSEALDGKPYWSRVGTDICYYRNHFTRSAQATGGVKGKTYYTTTFTVKFKHNKDVCYLAYHYPYTYTTLQTHLNVWERIVDNRTIFFRKQDLCQTMTGNNVPVLTITAQPKTYSRDHVEELKSRPYIFISGRVHPGESNSSWVMKGTIDYLLSKKPSAQLLRETYIIKVVPMLNPDGVINGNHRCSVAAEDLNRRWDNPCPRLHPTIYHTKGMLQYMQMISKIPLVYCDYHGHSRRKNIFLYGCSPSMSWIPNDTQNPAVTGNRGEDNSFKTLPRILHLTSPVFSWQNCSFVVEKAKETTARMVVWRQIGVIRSYTMESSYCGIDKDGKYKDQHISTTMLEDMGQKFCEALLRIRSKYGSYDVVASLPTSSSSQLDLEAGAGARARGEDLGDNMIDDDNFGGGDGEDIDDMNEESSLEDDISQDDDDNVYDEDPS
ncbi:LOW QUALITY PROTEIN: cytosolic carboxypeptidase 1-like [Pecten maximus]|uniref:LOW QUALITY PROTEIN: cytosolic carboxypeptidase 1-like n=1 Tax=Pecten maximus TaxID=6579 RepID=UPI0014590CC8|nr:LOW QUALITY PROTEIN: cytosolic carboxypeptidase 1-like [Pecten maximus]